MADCKTCDDKDCSAKEMNPGESSQDFLDRQALNARMCEIKHKVIVLSGKGGVGKSTVAVNLAVALTRKNQKVGLMDVDVHGPSVPKLLSLEGSVPNVEEKIIYPVGFGDGLGVMSIGFMLRHRDDAVIWRGPMKISLIKQFLKDVQWGKRDFLIIDSPPGTGDEPLSVVQLVPDIDGAVIVTTPQDIALSDVRKSITFCRKVNLPVLGVVENMSGFICPHCGKEAALFKTGGAEEMAREMEVPFLAKLPMDPEVMESSDEGTPFASKETDSPVMKVFSPVVETVLSLTDKS